MSAETAGSSKTTFVPPRWDGTKSWREMLDAANAGDDHYARHDAGLWLRTTTPGREELDAEERRAFIGRVIEHLAEALGRGKVVRVLVTWEGEGG